MSHPSAGRDPCPSRRGRGTYRIGSMVAMAFNVDASPSASQRADESDLDPAAFLKTVRELSEKREREDAERYRALELEIERSREERAARRAGK